MRVIRCDPPRGAGIADWYGDADLLDCYAAPLPAGSTDMRAIAQAILGRPSWWAQRLLALRDGFARRAGLQTTADIRRSTPDGQRIGFFPIRSATDDEIILGEDDRHLDFRVSLLREKRRDGADRIAVTTVVRCHNRLGRLYLSAIEPFHRMIVRSSLRRAVAANFRAD